MEAHHYSPSLDLLSKIDLDEEEKDMMSFFFDSSFDREHLKSLPPPKESSDAHESHETLSEHIDVSDENFDVFGFRFLHVSIACCLFFGLLTNMIINHK